VQIHLPQLHWNYEEVRVELPGYFLHHVDFVRDEGDYGDGGGDGYGDWHAERAEVVEVEHNF